MDWDTTNTPVGRTAADIAKLSADCLMWSSSCLSLDPAVYRWAGNLTVKEVARFYTVAGWHAGTWHSVVPDFYSDACR